VRSERGEFVDGVLAVYRLRIGKALGVSGVRADVRKKDSGKRGEEEEERQTVVRLKALITQYE